MWNSLRCPGASLCLTVSHTCLLEPFPKCPWLWGLCQSDWVCVWLCQPVYHMCLHMSVWVQRGTWHPSGDGWQDRRLLWGGAGRAGLGFRGEEGRVLILPSPSPPGRQANGKNVHTRGGQADGCPTKDCSVHRKQVLLVSAQVWQEVAFGWQEAGFSSYQPRPRGRRALIWG